MLATYIHFTLVNHIEVVSFIAWREEKRRNTGVYDRAGKTKNPPGGKMLSLPVTTTSCFSNVDF